MSRARGVILYGLTLVLGISFLHAAEIHYAAAAGQVEAVKAIVEKDPNAVNERDGRGATPLHRACNRGQVEVIAFLLSKGADVKAADPNGYTPLIWAASAGQAGAARALIEPNVFTFHSLVQHAYQFLPAPRKVIPRTMIQKIPYMK